MPNTNTAFLEIPLLDEAVGMREIIVPIEKLKRIEPKIRGK
ncbi:MAG: hypothetical protein PHV08_03085 [Sulfurovaceae bacterium]|nr:hypothetical protein [Sulfurovaceae bacterium]